MTTVPTSGVAPEDPPKYQSVEPLPPRPPLSVRMRPTPAPIRIVPVLSLLMISPEIWELAPRPASVFTPATSANAIVLLSVTAEVTFRIVSRPVAPPMVTSPAPRAVLDAEALTLTPSRVRPPVNVLVPESANQPEPLERRVRVRPPLPAIAPPKVIEPLLPSVIVRLELPRLTELPVPENVMLAVLLAFPCDPLMPIWKSLVTVIPPWRFVGELRLVVAPRAPPLSVNAPWPNALEFLPTR